MFKKIILLVISAYQFVTRDVLFLRTGCVFYPTCSEYAKKAIDRFGVIGGGTRTLYRIARCNPFQTPRVDLPKY